MGVVGGQVGLDLGGRLALQGVFEDRGDAAVSDGLDRDGAQAGRLQALFPMGLAQSQDAQRGAVALLGVDPGGQHLLNGGLGLGTDGGRPVQEALGVPARYGLMGGRQVGLQGRVATFRKFLGWPARRSPFWKTATRVAVARTSTC